MSVETIHQSVQIARKNHYNDGADDFIDWVNGGMFIGYYTTKRVHTITKHEVTVNDPSRPRKLPISDLRIIVKMRKEKYKILKGTEYRRQYNKYDGYTYTWKVREDMYQLMTKYNLFSGDF